MSWLLIALLAGCGPDDADTGDDRNADDLPDCDGFGFASDPVQWTLPFPLVAPGLSGANLPNTSDHALVDLDGDGDLDFLVTRDEERASPDALVGRNHWLMFENTGDGFATSATEWRIPFPLERSDNLLATSEHAVMDLDGDGRPDFVVVDNGEREQDDPLLGKRYWTVYSNTGSGFSTSESEWTLPFALEGSDNVLSNNSHTLLSLTGGDGPDFVVIVDDERPSPDQLVGTNHWLVFENTGAGFQTTASTWALPFRLRGSSFDNNELSNSSHTVTDLNGDALPDFVVHRDDERTEVDQLVGTNHWLLFENTGFGFTEQPATWSLPFSLRTGASNQSQPNTNEHALLDASGDAMPDFVAVTDERREPDPLTGRAFWPVFRNTGFGFEQDAEQWELPYALLAPGFDANDLSTSRHAVMDMDGDGLLDFVEYANGERVEEDALLGKQYWRVYKGECQ